MADNRRRWTTAAARAARSRPRPRACRPVLDEAHIGDIRGALGTIKMDDTARATAGARA